MSSQGNTEKFSDNLILFLHETLASNNIIAKGLYPGIRTENNKKNNIIVFKGTKIPVDDKLTKSKKRKTDALKSLYLVEDNDFYMLKEDVEFSSPSLAAAIILGKECSGTRLWKNSQGVDLFTLLKDKDTKTKKLKSKVKPFTNFNLNKDIIESIKQILSEKHNRYLKAKDIPFNFTNNLKANQLVKDIDNNPEAFFIGCLMDRGIKAEVAWTIPYKLNELLGSIRMYDLNTLSYNEIESIFIENNLHRYKKIMADGLYKAVNLIIDKYQGNPSNIWSNTRNSNVVVKRFKEFKGIGEKISTMAVNILYRDFKIPFDNLQGIDISPDTQVLKVFKRLGLINDENNTFEVIEKAREMNPDFPGIYDVSTWEIGRKYCHKRNPNCTECPLDKFCIKII